MINLEDDLFVMIIENHLEDELCDEMIERFENDQRKYDGVTGGGLNKEMKDTKDLHISDLEEWKDIDNKLFFKLQDALQKYFNKINLKNNLFAFNNIDDLGYQIQKYNKNEGKYLWHHDSLSYNSHKSRIITYLWYLNTLEEGGETEFLNGKIKPEKGKLILFPSTWTFYHRAHIPISDHKYICTGWILSNI